MVCFSTVTIITINFIDNSITIPSSSPPLHTQLVSEGLRLVYTNLHIQAQRPRFVQHLPVSMPSPLSCQQTSLLPPPSPPPNVYLYIPLPLSSLTWGSGPCTSVWGPRGSTSTERMCPLEGTSVLRTTALDQTQHPWTTGVELCTCSQQRTRPSS